MSYQRIDDHIIRLSDQLIIPIDPSNVDYQEYLQCKDLITNNYQQTADSKKPIQVKPKGKRKRARNALGQFISDDPTTSEVNEAWEA